MGNGTYLQDQSRPLEGSFQTLLHLLSRTGSTKKLTIALKALYDLTRHPTSAVSFLRFSFDCAFRQVAQLERKL